MKRRWLCAAIPVLATLVGWALNMVAPEVLAQNQPAPQFEVHDWSVWLADPTLQQASSKDHFPSAMPGVVDSVRNREIERGKRLPSPVGIVTFHGEGVPDIEVDLRVQGGRFLAHWPPAESKSNRLRWYEASLVVKPEDAAPLAFVVADHWFHQAREVQGLFVKKGARAERFIAYDTEFPFAVPLTLSGGPDAYQVTNRSTTELADVVISVPTPEGRRIGWLDALPAAASGPSATAAPPETAPQATGASQPTVVGRVLNAIAAAANAKADTAGQAEAATSKPDQPTSQPAASSQPVTETSPVEVEMSTPLAAESAELAAATTDNLKRRLTAAGLAEDEAGLVVAQYQRAIFESDALVVAFRLPQKAVEEKVPLVIYPEPTKTVRVALVVVRNIDPRIASDVDQLIAQLGSTKYAEREAAQKRLTELGRLAIPALKKALKHQDLEIVIRAERILTEQNESIE